MYDDIPVHTQLNDEERQARRVSFTAEAERLRVLPLGAVVAAFDRIRGAVRQASSNQWAKEEAATPLAVPTDIFNKAKRLRFFLHANKGNTFDTYQVDALRRVLNWVLLRAPDTVEPAPDVIADSIDATLRAAQAEQPMAVNELGWVGAASPIDDFLFRVGKLQEIANGSATTRNAGHHEYQTYPELLVTVSLSQAVRMSNEIGELRKQAATKATIDKPVAVDEREAKDFYTVLSTDPIELRKYAPDTRGIDAALAQRWLSVVEALDRFVPGWHAPGENAEVAAVNAIENLAKDAKPEPASPDAVRVPLSSLQTDERFVGNTWSGAVVRYNGYDITLKRDFGNQPYRIDGMPCMWGYIIGQNGNNSAPGATWFQTVEEAKLAIDILIRTDRKPDKFWQVWGTVSSMQKAAARAAAMVLAPIDEDKD